MAQKLTDKSILIAPPESGDWVHVVDVSDTSASPEGTSKRSTFANFTSNISASLIATHVGFGSGGGQLTGSSNFVWDDGISKLIASGATGASFFLSNTALGVDEKNWSVSVGTSGDLQFAAVNDAQNISTFALTIERGTGNTVSRIFAPTKFDAVLGVGVGSGTFDASAILEAVSTTQGFLPPRMTTAQKNAIATPATSLIVFDIDIGKHQYYTGSVWANMEGADPVLTDREIAFGSATNEITSSADFTWRNDIKQLLLSSSGSPSILFENTGQAADERRWVAVNNANGDFVIQAINDAGTAITEGILLVRGTGAAIDRISMPHRTSVNGSLVVGSATFEPSAILDVVSTDQGLLVPRMTTVEKNAIPSPAVSLIVFDTDIGKHQWYTGSEWVNLNGSINSAIDTVGAGELMGVPLLEPPVKFIGPVQIALQFDSSLAHQAAGVWRIPEHANTSTIKIGVLFSDEGTVASEDYRINISYKVHSNGDPLIGGTVTNYNIDTSTSGTPNEFLTEKFNSGNPVTIPASATPQTLSFVIERDLGVGTPYSGNVNIIGVTFEYDEN